jgi:hypothetical protein
MTTPPLATIFYGDVTLEEGSNPLHFGYGDLNVKNNVVIGGSSDGTSTPTGALIVKDGGAYIHKSLYVRRNFDVSSEGITNLHTTNINTDPGGFSVFGQNGVNIAVGSNSKFDVYNGDLSLSSSTGSVYIAGGAPTGDAVDIRSSNTAGGITVAAGTGGLTQTISGGNFLTHVRDGSGEIRLDTVANDQNLTLSLNGETGSRVIIRSEGTGQGAITLDSLGGISGTTYGKISLQTRDTSSGIHIGTDYDSVPVYIGRNGSDVTIRGNLFVRGTTTEVNQQVMTVDDNIIVVNNSPFGLYDGGFAVKRYQPVNDTNDGALATDTPELVGTVGNSGNSSSTINLGTTVGLSPINDYYKNWWVYISAGQGLGQWRKISSYNATTKIADIYTTNEPDVQPSQGEPFTTIPLGVGEGPENTSIYGLYPCEYVMNIWNESQNEFAYVCSPTNPSDPDTGNISIAHYTNLHVGTLIADNIQTPFVNNQSADIHFDIVLNETNSLDSPISLTGVTNYGLYLIFIKPKTDMSRSYGIFMVGRRQNTGPGDNAPGAIVRIISVKGRNGEHLDMDWPSAQFPRIYYRPSPTDSGATTYKVKMISI